MSCDVATKVFVSNRLLKTVYRVPKVDRAEEVY